MTDAHIVDYVDVRNDVARLHSRKEDLSEGDLLHRLGRFDKYVRMPVLVADLNLGEFALDDELVAQYMQQYRTTGTYPPIVFDQVDVSIIDGLHRANALARCGLSEIDAFVGTHANLDPDWSAELDDDLNAEEETEAAPSLGAPFRP